MDLAGKVDKTGKLVIEFDGKPVITIDLAAINLAGMAEYQEAIGMGGVFREALEAAKAPPPPAPSFQFSRRSVLTATPVKLSKRI